MKKLLLGVLIAIGMSAALPAATFAQTATTGTTHINGFVRDSSGNSVYNANVTVSCNGYTQTNATTPSGYYIVFFPTAECPDGNQAVAMATSGTKSGQNTGRVNNRAGAINITLGSGAAVLPEMGTVISGIAAVGAAGVFLLVRRQKQRVDQS